MQYRNSYQKNQYPTRFHGAATYDYAFQRNQYPTRVYGRAYGYFPAHERITIGLNSIEKLESESGKIITSQALTDSYMAISNVTVDAKKELAPVKEKNSFGMVVTLKMSDVTVPTQILLQDVTECNKDMIESIPVALSYQSMAEIRNETHAYDIKAYPIPSWKCMVLGNKKTRVYDVFKSLRYVMRREWVLKLKLDFKELESDKKFICAWMLSVKKVPSGNYRDRLRSDQLVLEDIGAGNFEYWTRNQIIPEEPNVLEDQTEGQGDPTRTGQMEEDATKKEPEDSMADTSHIKVEQESEEM